MEGPQSCISTEGKQDEAKNSPGDELVADTTGIAAAAAASAAAASASATDATTATVAVTAPTTTVTTATSSSPPQLPINEVGPEMMPTIPLVPVQLSPSGKVTLPKNRRRPLKGPPGLSPQRGQFANRRLNKIKRLGPRSSRGGRGFKISGVLDEKALLSEDITMEEEFPHDGVFISPAYQEKWPGRVCAMCCLGEMSQLGQGELTRFEPTSGYTLPEKLTPPDEDLDSPTKKLKPNQSPKYKGKSPRKQVGEAQPEPIDEISQIGHVEQPSISTLFLPTGQSFAHYMCALWSSGVELSSDETIKVVDKAVVKGASQRCHHCNKFGATLPCKASGCSHFYHLPCAMFAAAPMDLKSVAMLCSDHAEQSKDLLVDMDCMVCESPNSPDNMLFCTTCGNHYHGNCIKPHIAVNSKTRTGWQCPDCKTCQMCRQPGDEILCGLCDKPYHFVCARPFGLSLTKKGWKCKTCRVCGDCGSRTPGNGTSSRWHSNFTVCDSCYQLRNKGLACPICRKAYRAIMQKILAQCAGCKKHVHKACEEDADLNLIKSKKIADPSYEYICATCRKPPVPSPNQSPRNGRGEDSLDGEDSNDSNLMSEGNKPDEVSPLKTVSNFSGTPRGKPHNTPKRSSNLARLRGGGGGAIGKFGKKAFSRSNSKKGKANPAQRGGGGSRGRNPGGYRGFFNFQNVTLQAMENNASQGKEEGEENKVILVSAKDEFCTYQDICSMCGTFGQDQEGRLIGCAQCGQCYHPYCANVKVNKEVLEKGWRCLDCTVCEGCGERNDEARLVLCEECDISFHIYCMNPPLDSVPSGVWKCKWCAMCHYCNATDPGPNSSWKQNFSMCGPCNSIQQCPVCDESYGEGELIIQCSHCDRWLHASDDMIETEEDAERCAEKGYVCILCRPQDVLPAHQLPVTPPMKTPLRTISADSILKPGHATPTLTNVTSTTTTTVAVTPLPVTPTTPTTTTTTTTTSSSTTSNISPLRSTSPDSILASPLTNKPQHFLDGICLSESGLFQIKSLTLEPIKKARHNPRNIQHRGRSLDSRGSRDMDDEDDEEEEYRMEIDEPKHWVYGMKEGTILQAKEDGTPPDLPEGFYTLPGQEPGTYTLRKRRYRNIKTLGIGGFQVRARGKKEEERLKEEAAMDPQVLELRRKRSNWRTKKKIKLLEKFPSYMQEAFFGRNLMDTSNLEEEIRNIGVIDEESDEDVFVPQPLPKLSIKLTKDEIDLVQKAQAKKDKDLNPSLSPRHRPQKRKKKPGSRNVDKGNTDEEEDENNVNKAIDEIFSGGLFSDDLGDIMNDDMKSDNNSNNEDEEDDLDGAAVVGGGMRVSDILGPGFNFRDVTDIMKDLPEDSMEDSQDSTTASPSAAPPGNVVSSNTHTTTANGISSLIKAGEGRVVMAPGTPKTGIVGRKPGQPPLSTSTPLSAQQQQQQQLGLNKLAESTENLKDVGGNTIGSKLPRLSLPQVAPLGSIRLSSPLPGHNTLPGQSPLAGSSTLAGQQQQAPPQSLPGLGTLQRHQHQPGQSPLPPHSSLPGQSPLPEHAVTLTSQSQVLGLNTLPGQSHLPGQPAMADRERYIKGVWKKLDAEQRKIYIQKARDNKKEYYKNKQEQQRMVKQSDSCESGSNSAASSPQSGSPSHSGGSFVPPPMTSPRPQLPSLLNARPQGTLVQQRPQLIPSGMGHTTVMRPPLSQSDPYASMPGTPRPTDSFPIGVPRPVNTSPLGPGAALRPGGPVDPYAMQPGTPRPTPTSTPYAMPPPSSRPIDPYANPPGTPRPPPTSEAFGPGDAFSQGPRTGYVQAPSTPRPHDDNYQPPTPQSTSLAVDPARQQHLRELLQRQQQPPRGWSEGGVVPPPHSSPNAPGGPFRQPLPPMISGQPVRIRLPGKPGTIISHTSTANQMDPRFRQIIQHSIAQPGGPGQGIPQRVSSQPGSPLDNYNHLVQQRSAQYSPGGVVGHIVRSPGTVLVSQGMGSPHLQPQGSPHLQPQGSPHLQPQGSPHMITPPHLSPSSPSHQLQQQQQQMLIQQNMESELPEAVTRELEQLEEEQHQQQQHHSNPRTSRTLLQDDLVPGDLTTMADDDLLAIGGDFNALLEFADGEDEIEDGKDEDDTLPTNLFDDLDEDMNPIHPGMVKRKGVPVRHVGPTGKAPRQTLSSQSSNSSTPTPTTMVAVGPSSGGPPVGPPPGPIMGPVHRMTLSNVPGARPTQPLMAPQLTANPAQGGITRIIGAPPGTMVRQAGLPPPPYPGQPPPPYPRAQVMVSEGMMVRGPAATMPPGAGGAPGSPLGGPPGGPPPPGTIIRTGPPPHHIMGPQGPIIMAGPPHLPPHHIGPNGPMHIPPGHSMGPHGPHGPPGIPVPLGSPGHPHGPPGPPHGPPGPHGPHGPMLPPQPQRRPLLLQEQPLLIEDLLEQEKLEQLKQHKASEQQQQQGQQGGLSNEELNLSDMDFEKLKADVMARDSAGLAPVPGAPGIVGIRPGFQRIPGQPGTVSPVQPMTRPVRPLTQGDPGMHPALLQAGSRVVVPSSPGTVTIRTLPPPPVPPDNPQTDAERQQQSQYEYWLSQQHNLIAQQQRLYETEITKLRKQRKSLNSRQRTMKKNGQELSEHDASELERVQREAATIQRSLDQCRKSARQHTMIIQEYNNKKKQRPQMMGHHSVVMGPQVPVGMMAGNSPMGPSGTSPMHSTPHSPLMSPSPSSQHGMGMSPMVSSPHTPVASPNTIAVPQHSPHSMVIPVPHPSPGDSPYSPHHQVRMPSPNFQDQGPRPGFPGPGMPHHMIPQGMRVRMPVLSPGSQHIQPGQMSPHMMRPNYQQQPGGPGPIIMTQGQGGPMMMRPQYAPQGVMPLRRPSGSGPVPSPGSQGPISSPGGPVPSPITVQGMAMKPSPVHSGLKSPVPLSSPSSGGPIPSPHNAGMMSNPSPVHSGLRSPVPMASPSQIRPHSVENPGTPLTPRSASGDAYPHTPGSAGGSQVNSPSNNTVPSPAGTPRPAGDAAGPAANGGGGGGGGGGNANNPNNPAPLPPHFGRFGFFKLGLRGGGSNGVLVRSRWGHFKLGLKGGSPLGEIENATSVSGGTVITQTTTTSLSTIAAPTMTTSAGRMKLSSLLTTSSSSSNIFNRNNAIQEENQEGLAHVLSESLKSPQVRLPMMSTPSMTRVSQSFSMSDPNSVPASYALANAVTIPEPNKSEIPPSSRHQAVIGIPGGGAVRMATSYPGRVSVAPSVNVPTAVSNNNYPTSSTGGILTNMATGLPASLGINPGSIPSSIISPNTAMLSNSASSSSSVVVSNSSVDVSTLSSVLGVNDRVNNLTSISTSRPVTSLFQSTSASTHTTPSLGRPLVSVPIQQLQEQQHQLTQHHQPQHQILQRQLSQGGQPMMTAVTQVRTLPSVGQIQQGTQQIRMLAAPQPGMQQITSSLQQQPGGEHNFEQGGPPQAIQQHVLQQALGPGQQLVQTAAGVLVQNSAGQTVRMVGQPVMVQQMVRAGNVMVRGPSGGQVAVQGRQIMMIHGSQQVRTPSPPVSRGPVMMPPPISKSPAGHSASPIQRVSPAQSPLSNLPSPHSPQLMGQSPLMGSPTLSPHGSHSTPPGVIKRDPDDERSGPFPQAGSPQLGPNSTTSLPSMTFPYLSQSLSNQIKTEAGQVEPQKEVSPTSQNALLKQLLQNTACASSIQQQQGGQLVLVRSPQTNLPVASQHLSQIASQVPNPTPIVIPRNSSVGPHSTGIVQQAPQGQIIGQTSTGPVRMVPQQVMVSGQPGQPGQTVVIGHPGQPHQQLITHGPARPVFVSQQQPQQGPGEQQQHSSSQQQQHPPGTIVRQVSQIHPGGHPGGHPGLQSIPGGPQLVHQGKVVTHGGGPLNHPGHQSGSPVVHHTMRTGHPGAPLPAGHPASSIGHMGSTLPTPASMADRISRDPGLKTEMRVMIPETVLGSGGPSTGDLTPEMTTPTDDYHDDEFKRAKKRAAQQSRRKSQSKETKVPVAAKRPRQGSRVEEDYDAYIDGVMQQLRAMPPLIITEPSVPRNFNLCPVFGSGDLTKLGRKDYDCRQGVLIGTPGNFTLKNQTDYYSTQPFGPELPRVTPAKTGPTQRGFYIHEFTPPKIGLPLDELPPETEPTPIVNPNLGSNRPTPCPTPTSIRDADSPDTVLSSSSPECVLPESPPPFKGLRLIDMDEDPQDDQRDRSISPSIPLLVPTPIRPGQLPFMPLIKKEKDEPEMDKENLPNNIGSIILKNRVGLTPALPLKDMGNINVTLTLSSQAGDDISNVLRNLANLLNIPPPTTYQMIEKSLENNNIPRLFHHKDPKNGKEQVVEIQSILNGQASFCKNCKLIIMKDKICKKLSEMPVHTKDEIGTDEINFCSQECTLQYVITHKVEPKPEKAGAGLDGRGRLKDEYNSEDSSDNDLKDEELDEVLRVPKLEDGIRGRPVKHKLDDMEYYPRQSDGKRFRGHKYQYWTPDSLPMPERIDKPTPKEMTDILFRMAITYRKPRLKEDHRQCVLCNLYGDSVADGPSRLLNYEVNKWVHLNCALWCEDVYETMNGALMNVEAAIKKASGHICEHCEQPGASTKCFKVRCCKTYHLNCAVKEGCTFYKNKTVYCQEHANKGEKENELSTLAVFRRVFIDRDDNRQLASVLRSDDDYVLRLGSLFLINIGQLLPNQLQAFHSPFCIYPVGYQVVRFYWSMRKLHKRCAYECSISDKKGHPEFHITVMEDGFEDLTLSSCSPKGVWTKILEPLAEMRQKSDVVKLFPQYISGEDLFGLTEPQVVRILESLPGVDTLGDYNFKYGRNPLFEMPLAINPTGSARAEPFNKNALKRYNHTYTAAGSVRTTSSVRNAAAAANLALTLDPFISFEKLHKHSISSQYKKMRQEWRSTVYLARSKIAGLGLYAARDIEKNTFIIEYIGEMIRSEMSNIRERRYEDQNRGIYMFRLDDARVVDASETGGLARYINHSCGPNCYTKTLEAEGDLRILIIANRKIHRGEELSYDYKFDEEDECKIPCMCGADSCRKWMN